MNVVENIVSRAEEAKKADENLKSEDSTLTQEERDKKRKEEVSQISNVLNEKIDEAVKIATFDVFDTLESFLDDPLKRVLVIQGDAGAGKTILVRLFEQKLWKRYNTSLGRGVSAYSRLPLRIVLSEVRSLNKAVDEFLISHGCDSAGVRDIKKKPAAILFDGYDEINQSVNLYNLNNLEEWKDAKVIFTSRKENLTALKEDYIYSFTPGRDVGKVLSYVIQPINEDQIRAYFKAQAAEDQQEAIKLERKLKELNHGEDYQLLEGVIMKEVKYLEKIPKSEEYEHLCETLHLLEEHLPEIEQLQEKLKAMKVEGVELLPLTEVCANRIDMLRRMIDKAHLKELATTLRGKALAIRNLEDYFDLLSKAAEELRCREIFFKNDRIRLNIQGLTKVLEYPVSYLRQDSLFQLHLKDSVVTTLIEEWLNIYEERCTPEYFATSAEIMRKDLNTFFSVLEKLKEYKSLQVIENDNFIIMDNIDEYIACIETYSQFEEVKAFIKKTRKRLPEWKTVERELELLYQSNDDQFAQFSEDQEAQYKETTRFKKIKVLAVKHRNFFEEFYSEFETLELFNRKIALASLQLTDAFINLCDKDTEKHLEAQLIEFGKAFDDFNTRMSNFRYLNRETNYNIMKWGSKRNRQTSIFFCKYIEGAVKSLTNKLEEIQQSTKELVLFRVENKKGSYVVKALHEQILKLRALDNNNLNSVIQRLDEIATELKTLDDQVKAIKAEVTEEALNVASLQREIANLRRFSDVTSVEPIIEKFKDITTSPFMLRMLVQTLVKFPKSSANKAELYRLFSNIHFEREKERLLKVEKIPSKFNIMDSFYDYSTDLAINMFIKKVTSIQFKNSRYKKQGVMNTKNKDPWSRFFDDSNIMIKLARRGAQIVEDDGVIRFVHKSIMEYFAARQFYDDVVDYNPDELEIYEPCLNAGSIIDNETAVYHFLKDISESDTKKTNDALTLTVFEKKLLEILNSSALQKLYGDNFEQNFFYLNIFLMLLLRDNVQFRISMLKEDSPAVAILGKIVSWMFNLSGLASETGPKFAEIVERANKAGLMSRDVFQQMLSIHYHLITKSPDGFGCEDRFLAEKNNRQIKIRLSCVRWGKSIVIKDGILFEPPESVGGRHGTDITQNKEDWAWILSGKLFIHGSQDSVVILKHETGNKCLAVGSDREPTKGQPLFDDVKGLVLNDVKSSWNMIENKWILRLDLDDKKEFTLVSLADSSKQILGRFSSEEEFPVFFKDLCTYDIHMSDSSISHYAFLCLTCNPNRGSKHLMCKNCIDICHKGHQVIVQEGAKGHCSCRFASKCKIAFGCTEKKCWEKYKDDLKFKCSECPADKRNIILCNGCKLHHEHETSHKSFIDVVSSGRCECDCISNKTRVIVEATIHRGQSYYRYEGYDEDEHEDENDY